MATFACGGSGGGGSSSPTRTTPATTSVVDAPGLIKALSEAIPGDTIQLASGTYAGTFVMTRSGSASQPITLTGPADAVLQNNASSGKRYGVYLNAVNYWVLKGFTIKSSQKGIVTDQSNFNLLENLTVFDIEDEAVHFRLSSSDNTIKNSKIYNTGLVQPQFGEGVYIGSSNSNWATITGSAITPDASNRNQVIGNTIGPNVTAEGVDIREGTSGGLIKNNNFDTTGIFGQNSGDSAIDVKGDAYLVQDNTVTNTPTVANSCDSTIATRGNANCLKDGFQVHLNTVNAITYGYSNRFSGNTINLNTTGPEGTLGYIPLPAGPLQGYGINVPTNATGTVVCSSNSVINAIAGLSNGGVSNLTPTVCL